MGGGFHYRCNKIATPNRPARNSASDPAQRAGHGIVQHRAIARDCRAFVVRQVRVPAIENQHGAALVGMISRLVFDGIVKRKGLPRDPFAGFTAHAKTAVRRNIQRQMRDRARVGNAGMRRNAGVRFQQRKECVGRSAGSFSLYLMLIFRNAVSELSRFADMSARRQTHATAASGGRSPGKGTPAKRAALADRPCAGWTLDRPRSRSWHRCGRTGRYIPNRPTRG